MSHAGHARILSMVRLRLHRTAVSSRQDCTSHRGLSRLCVESHTPRGGESGSPHTGMCWIPEGWQPLVDPSAGDGQSASGSEEVGSPQRIPVSLGSHAHGACSPTRGEPCYGSQKCTYTRHCRAVRTACELTSRHGPCLRA